MELEPPRTQELLAAARNDLLALPTAALLRPRLPRERVLHLTSVIQREFEPLLSRLDDELSPARAAARRADYHALEARARVYYDADLAVEQPWSFAEKAHRAELIARAREHDETLSGWAVPLFRKDEEASAIVADILRGKGIRDDAEDTLRLVQLFRSRWPDVAGKTPVTEAQLAQAEADATELIEVLDSIEGEGLGAPRDLRRRAFTWWFQPYTEIFLLGRYLLRHDVVAAERFPGVLAERAAGPDRTPAPPER